MVPLHNKYTNRTVCTEWEFIRKKCHCWQMNLLNEWERFVLANNFSRSFHPSVILNSMWPSFVNDSGREMTLVNFIITQIGTNDKSLGCGSKRILRLNVLHPQRMLMNPIFKEWDSEQVNVVQMGQSCLWLNGLEPLANNKLNRLIGCWLWNQLLFLKAIAISEPMCNDFHLLKSEWLTSF